MLIERDAFMRSAVDSYFLGSVTAGMSDLLVAWEDDLIHSGNGDDPARYASGLQSPTPLLYRSRLSSPLDGLELIYRIRHLPPAPGASVLGWLTAVIAVVFCGGFVALYRLGAGQIELARQQQDFVSAVSHELKTPLTSIRMYGEMLKEGWADPAKRQQYYEYIHEESERLTRLITNVLQLASITRNKPKLDIETVEVGRLMQDVEDRIADQVRHAGFELRVHRDPQAEVATVEVDPDCFVQIVLNLVDNAIKFSMRAETRAIELSSRPAPNGGVRFSVRDFGPGIPANQMKKIFRLFYRAGNELTRQTVGTGIGLAIVHELSHAMGGKVDVANRDPGAEFTVALPAAS
jgi:signal transduction histidine kinase